MTAKFWGENKMSLQFLYISRKKVGLLICKIRSCSWSHQNRIIEWLRVDETLKRSSNFPDLGRGLIKYRSLLHVYCNQFSHLIYQNGYTLPLHLLTSESAESFLVIFYILCHIEFNQCLCFPDSRKPYRAAVLVFPGFSSLRSIPLPPAESDLKLCCSLQSVCCPQHSCSTWSVASHLTSTCPVSQRCDWDHRTQSQTQTMSMFVYRWQIADISGSWRYCLKFWLWSCKILVRKILISELVLS